MNPDPRDPFPPLPLDQDAWVPGPLIPNPFAVLGLPEWPDLDDETVTAAWHAIADQTHPDRPDGGNLARYTQATAAYFELSSPWGRTEAFADLLEAAWAHGHYDTWPGHYPPGCHPDDPYDPAVDGPPPRSPRDMHVLGPIPNAEIWHQVTQIPARFRHGHPWHMAIRAAVTAGLCLAILTVFPGQLIAGWFAAALTGVFAIYAVRDDMAPPDRPVRRLPPPGKT